MVQKINVQLWSILAVIVFIWLYSKDTIANEDAKNVFGAFEFICLEQIRNPDRRPALIENIGAKEFPGDQAKVFLAPREGRAWLMQSRNQNLNPYVVALTNVGTCTITAPRSQATETLKFFERHTKYNKIEENKRGSQIEYFYAVSHDNQYGDGDVHALVMISASLLFDGEGIILNALPEALLKKDGMALPKWPN